MAEGDTIHRTAARLETALGGERLTGVEAPNPQSPLRRQTERLAALPGQRLQRAEARGKHLLLRFDGGLVLHCHQGMRGSWLLRRRAESWPRPPGSAWLVLSTPAVEAAEFGGSHLALGTEREIRRDPRLSSLGPDILGEDFDLLAAAAALRSRGDRELGDALLDQGAIAGIGNVYKAEACFTARVDPWRRVRELSDEDLRRVVSAAGALMRAGLESGRRPDDVYRRARRPCRRCGTTIRSRGQGDANRVTYWCPGCQH